MLRNLNVGAASGHVGGDRDHAYFASPTDQFRFVLVQISIQDLVG